tara:strand:+ start:1842 stop:2207 length:366 start_codon:yes stop_codon:yes gene_type:complete
MYDYYEIRELMDMNNESEKKMKVDNILNKINNLEKKLTYITKLITLNTTLLNKISYEENKCNSDYETEEETDIETDEEDEINIEQIGSCLYNHKTHRLYTSDEEVDEIDLSTFLETIPEIN